MPVILGPSQVCLSPGQSGGHGAPARPLAARRRRIGLGRASAHVERCVLIHRLSHRPAPLVRILRGRNKPRGTMICDGALKEMIKTLPSSGAAPTVFHVSGTLFHLTAWSAFGACGTTCGTSTQSRTRLCAGDIGPPCTDPLSESQPCSVGMSSLRGLQSCMCRDDERVDIYIPITEIQGRLMCGTTGARGARAARCVATQRRRAREHAKALAARCAQDQTVTARAAPLVCKHGMFGTEGSECSSYYDRYVAVSGRSTTNPQLRVWNMHDAGTPFSLSSWSAYGTCGTACGTSTQSRTRTCDGTCGTPCAVPLSESQACTVGTCSTSDSRDFGSHIVLAHTVCLARLGSPFAWDNWSSWGSCGTACGNSTQARTRACLGSCGTACVGGSSETQSCTNGQSM